MIRSPEGRKLLFYASGRDHRRSSPYEVEIETGYVRSLLRDLRNITVSGYSPDGKHLCGTRPWPDFGYISSGGACWWRKGYRGSDNSQVFLYDRDADEMEIVTDFPGADLWPLFSADGSRLFFVSEREGRPNLFSMDLESREVEALTQFDEDAVTWLSISGDRKWLVFEWNFDVWMLSVSGGEPRKVTLHAPIDYRTTFETTETVTEGIEEIAVNRDGSLVAILMKDDIFFVKRGLEKEAVRITEWPGPDGISPVASGQFQWSPDGKQLAYVSDRFDTREIRVADAETYETRCLMQEDEVPLTLVHYTPDGKSILFGHGWTGIHDGVLAVVVETGEVTPFLPDAVIYDVKISPDGRWALADIPPARSGCDLYIKPLEGGEWVNITKHGDQDGRWAPDGKKVFFTSRRDGNREIYSIDLQRQPVMVNDYEEQSEGKGKLDEEIEQEVGAQAEKPKEEGKNEQRAWEPETIAPIEIDFEGIAGRAKRLTNTPQGEGDLMILPDAKTIIYTKDWSEIWAMDPDGENQRQYVTGSFGLPWRGVRLQGDGKAIFFVDHGKLKKVSAKGGEPTEIEWQAEIHRDEREVQKIAFRQAWAGLDRRFYASDFHGGDWPAVYERYAPYCDGTLVKEDLYHLIRRMLGELNVSYAGVSDTSSVALARGAKETPDVMNTSPLMGCLGIVADAEHRGPGVRVADVIPEGPADQPDSTIAVGEYVMAIEGEDVANSEDFHRRLNARTDESVRLLVNREAKLEGAREILIEPVSIGTIQNLRYERWVHKNREMVRELSGGCVYYAWIESMGLGPLERFKRELLGEAQKYEALLIDVRNKAGGKFYDDMLDLLTGQWFDGRTAVLINQDSRSGSELFPYGFRQTGLGKLIGTTTKGAVLTPSEVRLINGTYLAVPTTAWFTREGMDMENMGVKPDVEVPYPYEAYRDGKDPQIEAAVEVLLKELKEHPRAKPPEVNR